MTEKKNSHPMQPGSHLVSYQHRNRKPTSIILHPLATKCKSLNWRWILLALLAFLVLFSFVGYATRISRQQEEDDNLKTITIMAPEPIPETTQPPAYVFIYGEGCPVNMQAITDTWAAEAGFEKRYIITDKERYELASVITAEAIGEPFAGKVAVAQCILQACEDDGVRPIEALARYKYSSHRPEPTDEALAAVAAVFDFGHIAINEPIKYFYAPELVESLWHESQVYVMTINNHKFFKEVQHEQRKQELDRSCDGASGNYDGVNCRGCANYLRSQTPSWWTYKEAELWLKTQKKVFCFIMITESTSLS